MSQPLPNVAPYFPNAGFVYGMRLTYASTTTITVSQGYCRDSTGTDNIVLGRPPQNDQTPVTTPFTLNIALSGAGGLDTGTVADNKCYNVFVIASSSNSQINNDNSPQQSLSVPPFTTPDPTAPIAQDGYYLQANVIMSLSLTPVLPAGFDMYRRIGAIATDGTPHVRKFVQTGWGENRTMFYDGGVTVATAQSSAAYTTIFVTLTSAAVIPQVPLDVLLRVAYAADADGGTISFQPFGGTGSYAELGSPYAGQILTAGVQCPSGVNATPLQDILYECSNADDAVSIAVQGYVDQL